MTCTSTTRRIKGFGAEYLMDVVLLCRMHHQTVHDLEKHGFQLWGATKLASRPPERIAKILSRPYYRKGDKKPKKVKPSAVQKKRAKKHKLSKGQ